MTNQQLFNRKIVEKCTKKAHEMVSSAVERAEAGLGTIIFASCKKEAERAQAMIEESSLSPELQLYITIWVVDHPTEKHNECGVHLTDVSCLP